MTDSDHSFRRPITSPVPDEKRRPVEQMGHGFIEAEILRDADGRALDYRILDIHPIFEKLIGLPARGARGRTMRDVLPRLQSQWLDVFDRVVRQAESKRFEQEIGVLDRWFEIYASPAGGDRFIVSYEDVTARKRGERHAAFLDLIGREFAHLSTPDEILQTVGMRLGEYLQLSGCIFADVDETGNEVTVHHSWTTDDVPPLKKTFRLDDYLTEEFSRAARAGEPFVVDDTSQDVRTDAENYARLRIGSFVTVPFHAHGRWTAYLAATRIAPSEWRRDEIELLQEISHRLFSRIDRSRADAALRQTQQLFSALVSNAPFGIYMVDADFRLQTVNRGAEAVFSGIEPLIGRDFAEILRLIWQEPFATEAIERFRQTLATGESFVSPPIVEPRANIDEIQSYDWQIHRVTMPDGRDGVVCYFYDLSEQKRLEESVRRSAEIDAFRARLADALRPLSDPMEIQEAASRLVGEHLGVDRVAFAETRADNEVMDVVRDWTSPGTASVVGSYRIGEFGEFVTNLFREGRPLVVTDAANDTRIPAATYAETWERIGVRATIACPLIKHGRFIAAIFVHACKPRRWSDGDISLLREVGERTWWAVERSRAEAATLASERQLAAANRRKDEFLAMLGHELRNPLGVIASAVQLIRVRGLQDPTIEKALTVAERQSAQMARLVDELLDVARITESKITLKRTTVNLTDAVNEAVEAAQLILEASRHHLTRTLPSEPLNVTGDAVRLAQIVGNLLHNAAKYTPPGGEIAVVLEQRNGEALIRVRDNGQGIPRELLPSIFDLFVQGTRGRDRTQGGLGVGLTVVKRLVEMHGGRIEAASPGVGYGSEFTVTLPLAHEREAGIPTGGASTVASPRARRRVLVVDDNPDGAAMLALLLEGDGHEVVTASSGSTALARAASFKPDVAILDIGMPGMDGYELAMRLRQSPTHWPDKLVALTGYGQQQDIQRSRVSGFDAHLVKPVDIAALRRLLEQ